MDTAPVRKTHQFLTFCTKPDLSPSAAMSYRINVEVFGAFQADHQVGHYADLGSAPLRRSVKADKINIKATTAPKFTVGAVFKETVACKPKAKKAFADGRCWDKSPKKNKRSLIFS